MPPQSPGVSCHYIAVSVHCPLSTVHCTEGTEKRDVSMMLREGVEVERVEWLQQVEVLSDGGADGGGQR